MIPVSSRQVVGLHTWDNVFRVQYQRKAKDGAHRANRRPLMHKLINGERPNRRYITNVPARVMVVVREAASNCILSGRATKEMVPTVQKVRGVSKCSCMRFHKKYHITAMTTSEARS
jgi:hypothetical protein